MTFGKSVKTGISKYGTFKGRASRSEYWWWYLFSSIVGFVGGLIDSAVGAYGIISAVIAWLLLPPGLAVAVRRIHDSNHNGWWVICPIYNLILMFFNSTPGVNDYGELED